MPDWLLKEGSVLAPVVVRLGWVGSWAVMADKFGSGRLVELSPREEISVEFSTELSLPAAL